MAAPFDNSTETSFSSLSNHTGEGVVIDIGTGDGRFVSTQAKAHPNKFFIGIDANVQPLEKPSMKATRKPAKGGLPNALFVQAAVEELPDDLNGVADEIHIHFPWGSLLGAVLRGDWIILQSLARIAASECLLEIVFSLDPKRDAAEIKRLKLPDVSETYISETLIARYREVGFGLARFDRLDRAHWSQLNTNWAKKLSTSDTRIVWYLVFEFAKVCVHLA